VSSFAGTIAPMRPTNALLVRSDAPGRHVRGRGGHDLAGTPMRAAAGGRDAVWTGGARVPGSPAPAPFGPTNR
jgi:hypothetical protein